MAADVAQNAAKIAFVIKPVRAPVTFAVRTGAEGLHHAPNCPLVDKLTGKNSAFNVQTLAVIDCVFAPGFRHHRFGVFKLCEGG